MQHAFERNVGNEMALPGDEAAVLADAAVGGDNTEGGGIGAHFASTTGFSADAARTARIGDAQAVGGEFTASTIWP